MKIVTSFLLCTYNLHTTYHIHPISEKAKYYEKYRSSQTSLKTPYKSSVKRFNFILAE